ncbi:MAG: S8 family peptidase [Gemmataceae bacterium]
MRARSVFRGILVTTGLLFALLGRRAETTAESAARDVAAPPQLARLGVDSWHRAGVRGAGVKVAVLDSGFRGYRDQLGRALPTRIPARAFRFDGSLDAHHSNHGVACAQVIHAIAPDAELLFANWEPDHPETFVEAVKWCRSQGAKVVSCSVVIPAWGDGEGGGAVHAELARLVGAGRQPGDLLAVACAGNLAQRHWSGRFIDAGAGYHQWTLGRTDNMLTPWGEEPVSVELCGPPTAAYSLELFDGGTRKRIAVSQDQQTADRSTATLRFVPEAGRSYRLRARLTAGRPGPFHLVTLGSWLEHSTTPGSIAFPGDGPEWLTVGAVDADGRRAAYSGCGPNSPRPKPDLMAPVPFPTACRPAPFTGTSAAAPQVAGLAALVWSAHSDWTAEKVRQLLCRSCRDLGPPGHDAETGFGLVRLP